jgi:hypothetical protein
MFIYLKVSLNNEKTKIFCHSVVNVFLGMANLELQLI